jgi:hypothetical protein
VDTALAEGALPECIRSFTSKASYYGREGMLDCAKGGSCDSLLTCLNGGGASITCSDYTYAPSCDGAVYHGCLDGREYASVCTGETTCSALGGIPHWPCGLASCDEATTPATCDELTGEVLACEQTMLVPTACESGLTCLDGACVGAGSACNTTGGISCDGDILTYCTGAHRATRDCALTGHTCGTVAGAAACVGTGCSGRGLTASCTGTVLTLCDDGVAYTFDCGEDGLACCGAGI